MADRFQDPVRILSDLHLGHPGSRIAHPRQLTPLLRGVRTIVFNGDTSEERMKKCRARSKEQLEELQEMCAQAEVEMVRLRGNHDPHSPEHGAIDLADGIVFVTHGDILYPDISPWSKNAKYAREALGRIEPEYPPDYRDDLDTTLEVSKRVIEEMGTHQPRAKQGLRGKIDILLAQGWPPYRPFKILKTWWDAPRKTLEILNRYRPDAKVAVVGHTHRAFFKVLEGKVLVNTGGFLPLSKAYAVDLVGGDVEVKEVDARDGKFFPGKTIASMGLNL